MAVKILEKQDPSKKVPKMKAILFQPDKKSPLRLLLIGLVFIYLFQYPLMLAMEMPVDTAHYDWVEWMLAYGFVFLSTTILATTLYIGMSGKPVVICSTDGSMLKAKQKKLFPVLLVLALFFFLSYVMLQLRVGMTIYIRPEPLPFKLTGLLFYSRLFIQPMILAYIAYSYSSSKWKNLILVLMLALGAWVALTSGSRFASIVFAFPLIVISRSKSKYLLFGIASTTFISIATLSRSFYLPFVIGEIDMIQLYASAEQQAANLEGLYLLPFQYILMRSMGIVEVLMTMNYGEITPSIRDSLQNLFAYFLPFIPPGIGTSVRSIYGVDDNAVGGYGLDLFSNYWVICGGDFVTYVLGLTFSALLMGQTYRLFSIGMCRLGFNEGSMLFFILLLLLLFEGRSFLFPWMLIGAWLLSIKSAPARILSIMNLFSFKHIH